MGSGPVRRVALPGARYGADQGQPSRSGVRVDDRMVISGVWPGACWNGFRRRAPFFVGATEACTVFRGCDRRGPIIGRAKADKSAPDSLTTDDANRQRLPLHLFSLAAAPISCDRPQWWLVPTAGAPPDGGCRAPELWVAARSSRLWLELTVSSLPGAPRAPQGTEGSLIRILGAGRWIWVVGVVVVLSGCTGGSVPADVGLGTGVGPPAAGGPPTVSV